MSALRKPGRKPRNPMDLPAALPSERDPLWGSAAQREADVVEVMGHGSRRGFDPGGLDDLDLGLFEERFA